MHVCIRACVLPEFAWDAKKPVWYLMVPLNISLKPFPVENFHLSLWSYHHTISAWRSEAGASVSNGLAE